jgi:HD-GYP domain-containing protein (c-di-GMP phosphodiesterase class II)
LDLFQARSGSLMLIAEGGEEEEAAVPEMRIVVAQGLPEEVVRTARVPVGQGIAGSVAARGEPLILRRGVRDERSQSDQARAAQAALCVPLRVKDRVIGVLNLSERYDGEDFTEEHLELTQTLASQAAVAIENSQLHGDLREMFFGTISTVANAIDARDPYTRGHSERVTQYALLIAREVGFPKAEREALQIAALLHDVGKIAIEDEILRKPGKLTDEEYAKMKLHPGKVADILAPVKQLRKMVPYMKYHHEQYTAQGYPEGLHRENIPLAARIIAVADAYDAMTSDRPYRQGMPRAVALERLHEAKERQLDPRLVEAFARVVARGEIDPIDGQGMRDER